MRSPERSEAAWLGELKIGNCAPLDQFLLERDLHPSQTRGVPPESDLWADPPVDSASGLEVRRQRRAALKKEKKDTGQKKDGMLKVAGPAAALDSIPEEERGDDGEASQMILTDAAKESQRLQSAEAVRLQRLQSAEADRLQRLQSTEADRLQRPQSAEDATWMTAGFAKRLAYLLDLVTLVICLLSALISPLSAHISLLSPTARKSDLRFGL